MYPFGMGVIKISLLFLYHELFPSDTFAPLSSAQWDSSALWRLHAPSHSHFNLHQLGATGSYQWWPERYCVNGGALFTASAVLSMVTDIFILALPLRYLLGKFTWTELPVM
jgi:hypothetical protein